ncbi:RNA polymerase sigma factor [Neobacillus sp. NPDC093182]|uniref:RNA polymerase sigma factor n=1 Tax=Neobacillus sp. NPDC093182 TaxID=3364297 RepID=UPI0038202216
MKNHIKEQALVQLIIENKENFYRLAFSYVKNKDDALDIVQESIHKALLSIGNLKEEQKLKSWFYRIVVNKSLDFLRKHRRVNVMDDTILELYSNGNYDDYQNIDLERCLDDLPEKFRTVIVLRYFEDLKIEEIAEILKENQNTVKTRLYKALSMLRIQLEQTKLLKER